MSRADSCHPSNHAELAVLKKNASTVTIFFRGQGEQTDMYLMVILHANSRSKLKYTEDLSVGDSSESWKEPAYTFCGIPVQLSKSQPMASSHWCARPNVYLKNSKKGYKRLLGDSTVITFSSAKVRLYLVWAHGRRCELKLPNTCCSTSCETPKQYRYPSKTCKTCKTWQAKLL